MKITNQEIREILSRNLKSARCSSALTQETLAELSDLSVTFLKDIEGGHTGVSLLTLINICHSLDITPNQLLKDFFVKSNESTEDLTQKISFLSEYQKNAVHSLIEFFINSEMPS